jgi:hypothetical protein
MSEPIYRAALGFATASSDPRADGNRKFVRVLAISLTRSL